MRRKGGSTVKIVTIALCLSASGALWGQTFDTEFYPDDEIDRHGDGIAWVDGAWSDSGHDEDDTGDIFAPQSDATIFSAPAWNAPDPFRDFSRYRFGTVRYRERGLDSRLFRVRLAGIDLTDNLSSYPDWNLITLARRSGLQASQIPAMVPGTSPAGIARAEEYSLDPAGDDLYVLLRTGNRYSRGGGDIRSGGTGSRGWSYSLAATGQYGNDGSFAGIFSDEIGGSALAGKSWPGGTSLTFFAAGGISERGSRTAATSEAFELTGNKFYNPVWGWQEGRLRNSRTTNAEYLFAATQLKTPFGPRSTLSLTLAMRTNRTGRTRLAWYDAHSPLPDYYRSMPSFFPDWDSADIIADAWRDRDPEITQLDWTHLYYINTLAPDGRATYMIEEQVEAAQDFHARLTVDHSINSTLELSGGLQVRRDASRFYKVADDMLGAEWVPNVDQYVTDTDGEYHTAPPDDNDLRNPGRKVKRGERFGYDYAVRRLVSSAFGIVRWHGTRMGINASAELTHTRLRREGFYEKELFPGTGTSGSFGPSSELAFTTGSISAAGWLNVGARNSFSLAAFASTEAPFADDIFLSPRQSNLAIADPTPSGLYGTEFSWICSGAAIDLRVGGFVNATVGETQIRQYYDDLASRFADMVVRGIDRLSYGIEAGVEVRPTRRLSLRAGGSAGRYRYNSEPTATLYDDATGKLFSEGVICYMSGLDIGLPSYAAGIELAYSDRRYLRFSLSGDLLGGRAVEVNPLFRSSRVTGINSAPEIMARFTSQESLPDAFTVGLSLSKGWVVGRGFFRLAASVRNLFGNAIIHSGYEQMRIRRLGTGLDRTLVPFPPKYMYAYPTTWSVTLSYRL